MQRRSLLALTGASLPIAFAGCITDSNGGDGSSTDGDDGTNGSNEQDSEDGRDDEDGSDDGESISGPEPQSFEGSGDEVIDGISIEGPLVVVEGTYNSQSGGFAVRFYKAGGNDEHGTGFFGQAGQFDGANARVVAEGDYQIEVEADGNWSLTVREPRATQSEAESAPISISGQGSDVRGPFYLDGRHTVTGSHDGTADLKVWARRFVGSLCSQVFNENDQSEGATDFGIGGPLWLDIYADGNWSIDIE